MSPGENPSCTRKKEYSFRSSGNASLPRNREKGLQSPGVVTRKKVITTEEEIT